ncbi:MAG: helix-turn-helix domain-containing protein [Desulfovibrionaceae bacterium]
MATDLASLRARIEERHTTVYRFCRDTGLPRQTVYWVLSGGYRGDVDTQVARICVALQDDPADPEARVRAAIQAVACERCRRTDRRGCRACNLTIAKQARAVLRVLEDDDGRFQPGIGRE